MVHMLTSYVDVKGKLNVKTNKVLTSTASFSICKLQYTAAKSLINSD